MGDSVRIVGGKALMKRLDSMRTQGSRNRIVRPAVSAAATKINKKAKSLAVEETGLLKKSIGIRRFTKRGAIFAVVGPRHGFKQDVQRTAPSGEIVTVTSDPTKYAHLVEFGTKHSSPNPFLRPAYDSTPSERIMRDRMWTELKKEAKKK